MFRHGRPTLAIIVSRPQHQSYLVEGLFFRSFEGVFAIFWQFSLFLMFWLLVSGSFDWQHLAFGTIIASSITLFWHHGSERVLDAMSFKRLYLTAGAIISLVKEIWTAAWQVVPLVLQREIHISPTLVQISSCLETKRMRALYANSITLTPGTLTIQLKNNSLLVHALTEQAATDVATWKFEKTLKSLEEAK